MNEPDDLLGPLQQYATVAAYQRAVLELAASCDEVEAVRRHARLNNALAELESLASHSQQLAWLVSFGSPRSVRVQEASTREALWRRGVSRSTSGLPHPARATRLLALAATAPGAEVRSLLARLCAVRAFDALFSSKQPARIAAEAVGLVLAVDPLAVQRLEDAAMAADVEVVAVTARLARWMHAVGTPNAPDVAPPETDAARIALKAPILRGLRRRGARQHGRRIGRLAGEVPRQPEKAPAGGVVLPQCLTSSAKLGDLMAPLVIDFVTAAIAELVPGRSRRDGVHAFAERCADLVDAVAALLGQKPTSDHPGRAGWLENVLGLAPQSRWDVPPSGFELHSEPAAD